MFAAEVRKLAGDLMAFEEGPAADALDTGGAKWPYELRRRWRSLLEATTQPPEVRSGRYAQTAEMLSTCRDSVSLVPILLSQHSLLIATTASQKGQSDDCSLHVLRVLGSQCPVTHGVHHHHQSESGQNI